jgi:hypothetical protein
MKLAQPCSKPPFRLSPLARSTLSLSPSHQREDDDNDCILLRNCCCTAAREDSRRHSLTTHDHYILSILRPSLAHSNCIHYHYTLTPTINCTRTPRRHSTRRPLLALRPNDKERDAYIHTATAIRYCSPIVLQHCTID